MAFPPGFLDELRSPRSRSPIWSAGGCGSCGAGASIPGCARSTTRRRRRFTSSRTRGFFIASAAARMATRSASSCAPTISILSRRSSGWPARPGSRCRTQTPQERERAQRQKTLLEALAAAAEFYEAQLWGPAGARAREYLIRRGLDEETIRRFRLGWAPEDRQALRRALGGEFPGGTAARGRAAARAATKAAARTIISAAG